MPDTPQTVEDWLPCLSLPEYTAMIPTGQIRPIVGAVIWIDGNGSKMSSAQYIAKWGFDPQLAWDAIKEYRKQAGKNDHVMRL